MGCCYSYEEEDDYAVPVPPRSEHAIRRPTSIATSSQSCYDPYYNQQHRDYRAVPYPIFRSVPIHAHAEVAKPNVRAPRPGALYGEYRCHCGHFWVSRLSWRDKSQLCKRCKAPVRPKNQRELRPTDFKRGENQGLDHPEELCEMCQQVGGYCGKRTKLNGSVTRGPFRSRS